MQTKKESVSSVSTSAASVINGVAIPLGSSQQETTISMSPTATSPEQIQQHEPVLEPLHLELNEATGDMISVDHPCNVEVPHNSRAPSTEIGPNITMVAPTKSLMETLLKRANEYDYIRRYRVIQINLRLLEALRHVSPALLGGCLDGTLSPPMKEQFKKHREASVEQRQFNLFNNDHLLLIYYLVTDISEKLKTWEWAVPKHHKTFQIDGGWKLYILKLHQLILACLSHTGANTSSIELKENDVQSVNLIENQQILTDSNESKMIKPSMTITEESYEKKILHMTNDDIFFQTNAYEARSLWSSAVEAYRQKMGQLNSTQNVCMQHELDGYGDDLYRAYHKYTTNIPKEQESPNDLSRDSNRNNSYSDIPSFIEKNKTDSKDHLLLSPPLYSDLTSTTPKHLYDIYVTLIDNSSKYQQIGKPSNDNKGFMPATIDLSHYNTDNNTENSIRFIHLDSNSQRGIICLDCNALSFSIIGSGRYDAYLWALLLETVKHAVPLMNWKFVIPGVFLKNKAPFVSSLINSKQFHMLPPAVSLMVRQRACHALRVLRACLDDDCWSLAKCEYITHMLMSSSKSAVTDTLNDFLSEVWHSAFHLHATSKLKRLEGLLVPLLGHSDEFVRNRAIILLNAFYDQHDWQIDVPFVPVIKQVGDPFEITLSLDDPADPTKNEFPVGIFLILSAPSFNPSVPYGVYSYHDITWKPSSSVKGRISGLSQQSAFGGKPTAGRIRHKWIGNVQFVSFPRCGFFDWRVVRISEAFGSWETVQAAFHDLQRTQSTTHLLDLRISLTPEDKNQCPSTTMSGDKTEMIVGSVYPHPQRMAKLLRGILSPDDPFEETNEEFRTFPLQGRFIVLPCNVADEQMHEIFIDQFGCELDTTGALRHRGSFASITASLSKLRDEGITLVYLLGTLARDNGDSQFQSQGGILYEREDASPFAITCRCTPNQMCGGAIDFGTLIKEAKRVGMKIICDATTRVSSSAPHRKYIDKLLYYIDESGKKTILYGSGGKASNFEDTCQLNYRQVESWDLMVSDMRYMATIYGVDGFRLDNCQTWPPILVQDISELHREDPDGVSHYTVTEQLLGHIVLPCSEKHSGFWGSRSARGWPNPFLIKLCKELWRDNPYLTFIGECFGGDDEQTGKQNILARSGIIPQLQDLPNHLAKVFGHIIDPNTSTVTSCPPGSIKEIINWFDDSHHDLPEGAIVVQSSCSHASPLPGLLYGRGAWPAVDLLFFLPDVPSTFSGESEGDCFRIAITNVFSAGVRKNQHNYFPSNNDLSETCSSTRVTFPPKKNFKSRSLRELTIRSLVNLQNTPDTSTYDTFPPQHHPIQLKPFSGVRGLAQYEPLSALPILEAEHVKRVGPEFGFNLKKIGLHYAHRRRIRHQFRVFRRHGILVPLKALYHDTLHLRVLAFLRFDPETGEFVLVCINFSNEQLQDVSVSLGALSIQFRDMGLDATTVFVSSDLLAIMKDKETSDNVILPLGTDDTLASVFKLTSGYDQVYSLAELLHKSQSLNLSPFQTICLGFKPVPPEDMSPEITAELYHSALERLTSIVRSSMTHSVVRNEPVPASLERVLRFNFIIKSLISSIIDPGLGHFITTLANLRTALQQREIIEGQKAPTLHDLIVDSGLFCSEAQKFDPEKWKSLCSRIGGGAHAVLSRTDERLDLAETLLAKMMTVEQKGNEDNDLMKAISHVAKDFVEANSLGPIVFVTTELGKWSTVGGLGVMVDELSCTLAEHLGQTVYIVTPYYNHDRKGNPAMLDPDHICYENNITIEAGGETIEIGVHEGIVRGVHLIFLHNARFFPRPYPNWNVPDGLRFLTVMGKAPLEVLCQKRLIPQLIITNDWPTGLVAAYAKNPQFFSETFSSTTFFHIAHNLDPNYEGRLHADRGNNFGWITELPSDLLVDPTWSQFLFNPSRCALLTCDAWGTVSPSYRDELRRPGGSPLAPLLNRHQTPFAYPNGVPLTPRINKLKELPFKNHDEAKTELQRRYFGFEMPDLSIPLFAFIGRITEQKGVHHIVDAAEQLIRRHQCKIQIFVGGKVNWSDPYSAYCGNKMENLRRRYPFSFWADPNEFFSEGPLVNLGADVGLMPSKFEPGGIVQHEFFIAGTPVLAFRTGGLKDTVFEFDVETLQGNGFTFEAYQMGDFLYAMERAYRVIKDPAKTAILRENAKFSVISCEQAAQAWLVEFCRLRRKLPVNSGRVAALAKKYLQSSDMSGWEAGQYESQLKPKISVTTEITTETERLLPNASLSPPPLVRIESTPPTNIPIPGLRMPSTKEEKEKDPKLGLVPTRVRFCPKGLSKPRTVAVAGSFDNWQIRRPMTWDNAVQAFTLNMALRPGKYFYKLIVDGAWTLNPDGITEVDCGGNSNNILYVA